MAGLGLLGSEAAGSKPGSDQPLVTAYRRFHQRTLAVVGSGLPGQSSLLRDHLQMAVALRERIQFATGHGRRARWDHHVDCIAVRRDRLVSGCTIGRHPDNLAINSVEQRRHLGWVVDVLIRQGLCHDHAADGIDRQMQFAPCPARLHAMFRLQPLSRPIDLQTGAVDQYVQRTMWRRSRLDDQQRHSPTADRGVIRGRKRQVHQREDRCHQARLDGCIRIASLPALSTALPVFQRAVLDPQREAATPAQACLIRQPVLHLERQLRDVVTAISVVFVRHRGGQNQKGNGILPSF